MYTQQLQVTTSALPPINNVNIIDVLFLFICCVRKFRNKTPTSVHNYLPSCAFLNSISRQHYWKIKISHQKIIHIKEQLILQIVPRQVHSWWLCHHLSEKEEAAVASCSLATIYQRFNDLGFSYYIPQPVDVLGLESL